MTVNKSKDEKVIVQFSIVPIGEGASVSRYVAEALKRVEASGLRFQLTPMSTILEADDLGDAMEVILKAHEALFDSGAERVVTDIKIDDRRGKSRRMEDKVEKVKSLISSPGFD